MCTTPKQILPKQSILDVLLQMNQLLTTLVFLYLHIETLTYPLLANPMSRQQELAALYFP
jgi:hypothetical protein